MFVSHSTRNQGIFSTFKSNLRLNSAFKALPQRLALLCAFFLSADPLAVFGASSHSNSGPAKVGNTGLPELQVLFTDSWAAVLRTDMTSGQMSIIADDEGLVQPFGIAIGTKGEV